MVYKCCVPGCRTYSAKDKMPFHVFPKDAERFATWLKATKATVTIRNRNNYRICAIHFAPDAKFPNNKNRTTLKANAVPTLHLPPDDLDKDKPVSVLRDHSYVIKDKGTNKKRNGLKPSTAIDEEMEMDNIFFNNGNADIPTKPLFKIHPPARVDNFENTTVASDVDSHETNTTKPKDEETDESALFSELVAVRLRNLPQRTRKILMHRIDDLIFKTEMAEMDGLCSSKRAGVAMKTATPSAQPTSSFDYTMEA